MVTEQIRARLAATAADRALERENTQRLIDEGGQRLRGLQGEIAGYQLIRRDLTADEQQAIEALLNARAALLSGQAALRASLKTLDM